MQNLNYDNLVQRFKDVVHKYPHKVAVYWGDIKLTYEDLDKLSNGVAQSIINSGNRPGNAIGIYAAKNIYFPIAMLGVIKSGCFYVPMVKEHSNKNINDILEDSFINTVCICHKDERALFSNKNKILINKIKPSKKDILFSNPSNLIYRMYTSGSTGKAKGCNITHKNLLNFVLNQNIISYDDTLCILQLNSPAFDACVYEIWLPLTIGGSVVFMADNMVLDNQNLKKLISNYAITDMILTPLLLNSFVEYDSSVFEGLNNLISAGSVANVSDCKKIKKSCNNICLYNGYGPTENTVFTTLHQISEDDLAKEKIPIGRALNNVYLMVVDENNNILNVGQKGELCIAGDSLCASYHNNTFLNKDSFFVYNDRRFYKSGDLVIENKDGVYDYIERKDRQIKHHGYRVEISEIECAIKTIDTIADVVVLPKKRKYGYFLIAFYKSKKVISSSELRFEALKYMPKYMIPDQWVRVIDFPINQNGKVDIKKLFIIKEKIEEIFSSIANVIKKLGGNKCSSNTKLGELDIDIEQLASELAQYNLSSKDLIMTNEIFSLAEIAFHHKENIILDSQDVDTLFNSLLEGLENVPK